MNKKFCKKCNIEITSLNRWRDEKLCLTCGKIVKKERDLKHSEKRRLSEKLWRLNNPDKVRQYRLNEKTKKSHYKRTYGLSVEQVNDLLKDGCQVCGSHEKLVIDHCHTENKVRGCLCHFCNVSLGFAKDNPVILRKLADYIQPFINSRRVLKIRRA